MVLNLHKRNFTSSANFKKVYRGLNDKKNKKLGADVPLAKPPSPLQKMHLKMRLQM